MRLLNRLLRPLGVMLIPRPPSRKMVHECANIYEAGREGGNTVRWLRRVEDLIGADR